MSASESFKAGRLQEAIDGQILQVKANPADQAKRLFLFELLAFAGDLDRARRQIDAVNYNDLKLDSAVLAYRQLLDAEQGRRRLFSDGVTPQFFTPPTEPSRLRLQAVNCLRENRPAEAVVLLNQASDACPSLKGQLNGKAFESFRDCDDLFAGMLEVMANGAYYWVPLEQVKTVALNAPKYPRDLLWVPTRLEMKGGVAGEVFLPALYPGSHKHPDDQVKLGRMTDWKDSKNGPVLGVGLHTFLAGEDAVSLTEWRHLQLD